MALLVVGSVAFDTIRTPYGQAEEIAGGSATYFSVTASYFAPVNVVAVVGEDFGESQMDIFRGRRIDTLGLEKTQGKTFRWRGEYNGDMNEARTLETQLNVFQSFSPKIPQPYLGSEFVFLGNIDPALQLHVRRQMPKARWVACDTMNYWITGKPEELKTALAEVDAVVINEGEARMLSGTDNLRKASAEILKLGPRTLVVKRGEHGAVLFQGESIFFAPAYPLEQVRDPTGAGDSFAGGFMGYLARNGGFGEADLRRALVYGSVMASFAVEEFGVSRLLRVEPQEIEDRFRAFKAMTHFDV
ncbi:MAG: PfkB family carbohydrate kinase [Terriglobia bacterium]